MFMIPKIVVVLSVPVVHGHGDFLTVYSHAYALEMWSYSYHRIRKFKAFKNNPVKIIIIIIITYLTANVLSPDGSGYNACT